jgi:tetrahydromethanopterin S-methyltransferase subunit G
MPRRAEAAVVAALLHDVLDDTDAEVGEVQELFGEQVGLRLGWLPTLALGLRCRLEWL